MLWTLSSFEFVFRIARRYHSWNLVDVQGDWRVTVATAFETSAEPFVEVLSTKVVSVRHALSECDGTRLAILK